MINTVLIVSIVAACSSSSKKMNSIELISEANQQESIFQSLMAVTNKALSENIQKDSLAFLVLPVQASCPACRNKTIDSIVIHQTDLLENHFIIISANGGRKTINGYFLENNKDLPIIKDKLFLDTTNQAFKLGLYDKKPTIYYTHNLKTFKKVAAIPATVRQDLQEFFSGNRGN
jgi:hypothetical protein